jgi:hypothetical protein
MANADSINSADLVRCYSCKQSLPSCEFSPSQVTRPSRWCRACHREHFRRVRLIEAGAAEHCPRICEKCGFIGSRAAWPMTNTDKPKRPRALCAGCLKEAHAKRPNLVKRDGVRVCTACREEKPLDAFMKVKKGRYYLCWPCKREYVRRQRQSNPEAYAAIVNRRRERKVATGDGTLTPDAIRRIYGKASACMYCDKAFASNEEKSVDHFIPLAAGGRHSLANAAVSCRPCNSSKAAKDPVVWLGQEKFSEVLQLLKRRGAGVPWVPYKGKKWIAMALSA